MSSSKASSSSSPNGTEGDDIDTGLLEKRLEGLRDTQESVQGLSLWCQANKRHSQIIIDTWLRILRKSPVEKRLTMFYLANDVIQHAKRKNDVNIVNQWAFAIQKATPHVRSPSSVSNAIARIFKIWEERGVYSKDAIADLLSLLNNVSSKEKVEKNTKPETYTANAEKVATFQPAQLISKIKLAYRLKSHLGTTFRTKSYCQMDLNTLKNSIKDRQHGQDVIQEMGTLVEQLRTSEMKLQNEVEERRKIVEIGEIAIVFYENVRSESKIVNAAYKNFTNRVMKAYDAVDSKLKTFEEMEKEPSPCPSPPAAAPSPTEDDDNFDSTRRRNSSSIEVVKPSESVPYSSNAMMPQVPSPSNTSNMAHHNVGYTTQSGAGVYEQGNQSSQQQFTGWHDGGQNYGFQQNLQDSSQSQQYLPSGSMQMNMPNQHAQSYGFHGNKFDQSDVSSIPLPPPNPPLQNPPPLPQDVMLPQFPPPLPPQPMNPPVPDAGSLYRSDNPPLPIDDRSPFSSDMRQPPNSGFLPPPPPSDNSYSMREGIYQPPPPPSHMRRPEEEYIPQSVQRPPENLYVSPPPPPIPTDNMYSPSLPRPEDGVPNFPPPATQDFTNPPLMSPQGLPEGAMGSHVGGLGQSSDFYQDYESGMGDSQMQPQYVPKNNNYHPYNSPHRGRRPSRPQPQSRNLQPLLAAPTNLRFESRLPTPTSVPSSQIRFPGEQPNKIQSVLESPTSPLIPNSTGNFRPSHPSNFEGFRGFEERNISGPNGAGESGSFPFDGFQSQQQSSNPFLDNIFNPTHMASNNGPRRGGVPGRNFRGGGFRGSPRMRGSGPGGPRRGRF